MKDKICTGCSTSLSLDCYHKAAKGYLGTAAKCKSCKKEQYIDKQEHYLSYKQDWYKTNKDSHYAKNREWLSSNKDKANEWRRDWEKDYRTKNKAILQEKNKRYFTNLNKIKLSDTDKSTCKALYVLRDLCTSTFKEPYEVDHIIPISKGGLHLPENLQVLTRTENRSKSNKIVDDELYAIIKKKLDKDDA